MGLPSKEKGRVNMHAQLRKVIKPSMFMAVIMLFVANTSIAAQQQFLIGTYTQNDSEGVYKIALDDEKQTLTNLGLVARATNPAYLSINSETKNMLAALENDSGGIASFMWNEASKDYTMVQKIEDLGRHTCHISTSPNNEKVAIANYSSGDIRVFSIDQQLMALTQSAYFKNQGKGEHSRQEAPHMHYVQWDKTGRFLYAVDLGTDEIKVFDSQNDAFDAQLAAKLDIGDGPRHIALHPNTNVVYSLNELSNTVTVFEQQADTGKLLRLQKVNLLEDAEVDGNWASAIKVSADGRYVYAAVRGVNKIAVLSANTEGKLALVQMHSTMGNWPRDIELSADGKYLLIANQKSGDISVLARDAKSGMLSATKMQLALSTPSYIGNL